MSPQLMEPDPEDAFNRGSTSNNHLKESYASSDNGSQHKIITGVKQSAQQTKSAAKTATKNAQKKLVAGAINDKSRNKLNQEELPPQKVVLSTTEFKVPFKTSSPTPLSRFNVPLQKQSAEKQMN